MDWLDSSTPYSRRLGVLLLVDLVASQYVWTQVASRPAGRQRLLASLPVVAMNILLPLLFAPDGEVITLVAIAFTHTWLSNFKVAALALNRGPLVEPLTFAQFAVVLLAPITPQLAASRGMHRVGSVGRLDQSCGTTPQLAARFLAKTAALPAVVYCITITSPSGVLRECLYAGGLYLFLGSIMDGPASSMTALVGIQIAPHFNQPFASESVASFWGSRWNLTASNTLRFLVYDPICDGQWVARPRGRLPARAPGALRGLAACGCFAVSGAIHEVMYWYCQRRFSGLWFTFFFIQGPVCLLEMKVRRAFRNKGVWFPWWLQVVVTITALMTMAHYFFFPPAVEGGLADNVCASIHRNFVALYQFVRTKAL